MGEKSTCFSLPSPLSDENMYFCSRVKQNCRCSEPVSRSHPFLEDPVIYDISVISISSSFSASRDTLGHVRVIMCCFSPGSCVNVCGKNPQQNQTKQKKKILLKFPSLQSHALRVLKRIRTKC